MEAASKASVWSSGRDTAILPVRCDEVNKPEEFRKLPRRIRLGFTRLPEKPTSGCRRNNPPPLFSKPLYRLAE
jgi:hypothetical protein